MKDEYADSIVVFLRYDNALFKNGVGDVNLGPSKAFAYSFTLLDLGIIGIDLCTLQLEYSYLITIFVRTLWYYIYCQSLRFWLLAPFISSCSYCSLKVTGEPLIQRKDDTPAVLKSRLESFHRQTEPVCSCPLWNNNRIHWLFSHCNFTFSLAHQFFAVCPCIRACWFGLIHVFGP